MAAVTPSSRDRRSKSSPRISRCTASCFRRAENRPGPTRGSPRGGTHLLPASHFSPGHPPSFSPIFYPNSVSRKTLARDSPSVGGGWSTNSRVRGGSTGLPRPSGHESAVQLSWPGMLRRACPSVESESLAAEPSARDRRRVIPSGEPIRVRIAPGRSADGRCRSRQWPCEDRRAMALSRPRPGSERSPRDG